MKPNIALFRMLFALVLLCAVLSCSKEEDKRKYVTDMYGEPDFIESGQFGTYKIEFWVYGRRDVNRAVEFRKTESGCSGSSKWYIYQMYYADYLSYVLYTAPEMTHEPVLEAPKSQALSLSVTATDPELLLERFDLSYKGANQTEFTTVTMAPNPNDPEEYMATIPAEALSGSSLSYYVEMIYTVTAYEKTHTVRSPKNNDHNVTITSATSKVSFGPAETAPVSQEWEGLESMTGLTRDSTPLAP